MKKETEGRRSFLKQIMAGSAVIAGVTAVIKPARASIGSAVTDQGSETLYQETDDFKKYYESLRS